MADNKTVTYINFTDDEGLTIEVPAKQDSRDASASSPRIPPDLAPRAEHPLEKIMREKYEQRARSAFAAGLTVPTVKVQGATWGDAADMTADWFFEAGPERKIYRDGTPQVEDMKRAYRVNEARDFFYKKNSEARKKGQPLQAVTNYSGSFYPIGPLKAGKNPTQQFVGSYKIDIYPNKNSTVTFVLTNVTSMKSGTYHLGPEYPRGTKGVGGNQTQIYTWTESLRLRNFGN
jgi:hypothetical protein